MGSGFSRTEHVDLEAIMKFKVAVILVTAFLVSAAAYAHHSFAGTYIEGKLVKLEGDVVEFNIRNPHSFIKVSAPDEKGVMQTWSIEWGGGGQLTNEHVTRDTLKPGDQVVVTGNPGRDADEHRIRLQSITRPSDGWKWSGVIQ